MDWITTKIKAIMLVSGVLTCSMFYAAIDPQAALQSTFGASLESSPLVDIVVRNWGALITLVGGLLIYGAYTPPVRPLVLTVACLSKLTFISLILIYGSQYLGKAGIAIVFDFCVVLLFAYYLAIGRHRTEGTPS
jgi:hypothetical protein